MSPIYREDAQGNLHEIGTVYREDAQGNLHEVAPLEREGAAGGLTTVFAAGPAFTGILRPAQFGDVQLGGWEDSTHGDDDGDLWDELDEANPDGDTTAISAFIQAGGSETYVVALEDPGTTPNGQETQTVRITLEGADSGISWSARLLEGSTEVHSWSPQNSINGYATRSEGVPQAAKDSISDYTDLRVEVTASSPDLGSAKVTHIEMEFS